MHSFASESIAARAWIWHVPFWICKCIKWARLSWLQIDSKVMCVWIAHRHTSCISSKWRPCAKHIHTVEHGNIEIEIDTTYLIVNWRNKLLETSFLRRRIKMQLYLHWLLWLIECMALSHSLCIWRPIDIIYFVRWIFCEEKRKEEKNT